MTRSLMSFLVFSMLVFCSLAQAEAGETLAEFIERTHDRNFEGESQTPADTGFDNDVRAIGNYNGDLIVGGQFITGAGLNARSIVGWNGTNWFTMNWFPLGNPVYALHELNSELYAGQFLPRLNSWDGSSWTAHEPFLGIGIQGSIFALETFNGDLIVAGGFEFDTDQPSYIAKWNGAGWDSLGTGIGDQVRAMAV